MQVVNFEAEMVVFRPDETFLDIVYSTLRYTAKKGTDLLQVIGFSFLQLANKLQQTCQFHHVAASLLKSADLLQLVETTCCKPVDNNFDSQLSTSLLTTCKQCCTAVVASNANAS